jgi:hypothetical protein
MLGRVAPELVSSHPTSRRGKDGEYSRHLGAAADSIRGFNQTTDADYLKDCQALIGMYLQAVPTRSLASAIIFIRRTREDG